MAKQSQIDRITRNIEEKIAELQRTLALLAEADVLPKTKRARKAKPDATVKS